MTALFYRNALILVLAIGWVAGATAVVDWSARNSFLLWFEHWTGDWRTSLLADRRDNQHPDVAIVEITEETLAPYPYRLPADRKLLARLVRTLDKIGVRAIGIDFLFLRPTERDKDDLLAKAIREARVPVVIAAADARVNLFDREKAYQAEFIKRSGAKAGYANLLRGDDWIVRYLAPPAPDGQFPNSFAGLLADLKAPPHKEPRRIAWLLKPRDGSDTFVKLPAHLLAPPGIEGASPAIAALGNLLKGRIVLIGSSLADVDRHATPLPDWEGEEHDGVFLQAQVVAQILDKRDIRRLARPFLLTVYALLVALGLVFGLRYGLAAMTLYGSSALLGVAVIDMGLFALTRHYLPFQACALAMLLGLLGGALLWRLLRHI